jgi:hypothetical protein
MPKGDKAMRMGFRGSTTRRLVLVGLAVFALALIAVPLANAAPATTLVNVAGNSEGLFYGGVRELPCQVGIINPAASGPTDPSYYFITTATDESGIYIMSAYLPVLTYSSFTADAHALAPWATFFKSVAVSFTPDYDLSGSVGCKSIAFHLRVISTTVNGVVTNATTKKALSGVKVAVGNKSAKTSKTGKYSIVIGLWPATKYRATFSKSGFKSVTKTFTSAPGSTRSVNVALKKK